MASLRRQYLLILSPCIQQGRAPPTITSEITAPYGFELPATQRVNTYDLDSTLPFFVCKKLIDMCNRQDTAEPLRVPGMKELLSVFARLTSHTIVNPMKDEE